MSSESPTFTSPRGAIPFPPAVEEHPRTPGTIVAGRYRIVGLLGRGGMGEVYRADDLKLGQPVALKFLSAAVACDPGALARFHNEVRIARQVSHPHVCRIHDVGDADGEPFLSMEYIDGENLASLLRRIGRLPPDRAVDVARQLCAGLAAAHDLGVLHRDLKPANVMIDARGRVKIADFGLAALADGLAPYDIAGTPAYMAPEQLAGKPATVKTDVYALGLVLYEVFTGAAAFRPGSDEDRRRAASPVVPQAPSRLVKDVDTDVDRIVLRCLDPNPANRPASALSVLTVMSGGEVLNAALAAGETPSPEMVAAAGGVGTLRPVIAWGLFLGVIGALIALRYIVAAPYVASLRLSPDVLETRARAILEQAGYQGERIDSVRGFESDLDYARVYLRGPESAARWKKLAQGRPALIRFFYRQSSKPLVPSSFFLAPTSTDPLSTPGTATVILDTEGRLIRLLAIPNETSGAPRQQAAEWSDLFVQAGLRQQDYGVAPSLRIPPVFGDTRAAWEGVFPEDETLPLRIDAAAIGGRAVYFEITGPWAHSAVEKAGSSTLEMFFGAVQIALVIGAGMLARRNLRLGRSDRRGAFRLASTVLLLGAFAFVFRAHHVASLQEGSLLFSAAAVHLFVAAAVWLAYVAVEPLFRRWRPDLVISSTRLLAGRIGDPLVGRDLLVGAAATSGFLLVSAVVVRIGIDRGWPDMRGSDFVAATLASQAEATGYLSTTLISDIAWALGLQLLLIMLTMLLRRRGLAPAAFFVVTALLLAALNADKPVFIPLAVVDAFVATIIVTRFGLLASASFGFVADVLLGYPLTSNLTAFYMPSALVGYAGIVGLAGYGLYTSLNGRVFAGWRLGEEW